MALPELVTEHDHRLRILPVDGVGGLQAAAQGGRYTEVIEGVGAEEVGFDVFGQVAAGHREAPAIDGKGVFDDRRLPEFLPLRGGQAEAARLARGG